MRRRLLSVLLSLAGAAPGAEIVISGGGGPAPTTTVGTPAGGTVSAPSSAVVLLNGAGAIFRFGIFSLGWEVPVALGGPGRAMVFARGLGGATYTERMNLAVTPGARLRVLPGARWMPWVSAGTGIVRLERAGVLYNFISPGSGIVPAASQVGDRRVFAVSTAGGIDWKPGRLMMLRGEVRNYNFTTPETDFVGSFPFTGERRNNLLFLGGIGLRF